MPYKLKISEKDALGVGKFKNVKGNTECVEFIRQATAAPQTEFWKRGLKVADAKPGETARGTAIATFDDSGKYLTDNLGQHAAIYLSQHKLGVVVRDTAAKKLKFAFPSRSEVR